MTALDRAVALAEMNHVAVRVGEHLDLDVPRIFEVALDVDGGVGEVGLTLASRRLERALDFFRSAHHFEALPAAPRGGLDRDRPAELLAEPPHLGRGPDRLGEPWDDRHAR